MSSRSSRRLRGGNSEEELLELPEDVPFEIDEEDVLDDEDDDNGSDSGDGADEDDDEDDEESEKKKEEKPVKVKKEAKKEKKSTAAVTKVELAVAPTVIEAAVDVEKKKAVYADMYGDDDDDNDNTSSNASLTPAPVMSLISPVNLQQRKRARVIDDEDEEAEDAKHALAKTKVENSTKNLFTSHSTSDHTTTVHNAGYDEEDISAITADANEYLLNREPVAVTHTIDSDSEDDFSLKNVNKEDSDDDGSFAPAAEGLDKDEEDYREDGSVVFQSFTSYEQERLLMMFGDGIRHFFDAPPTEQEDDELDAFSLAKKKREEEKAAELIRMNDIVTRDVPERLQMRLQKLSYLHELDEDLRAWLNEGAEVRYLVDTVLYPSAGIGSVSTAYVPTEHLRAMSAAEQRMQVEEQLNVLLHDLHTNMYEISYIIKFKLHDYFAFTAEQLLLLDEYDEKWADMLFKKAGLIRRVIGLKFGSLPVEFHLPSLQIEGSVLDYTLCYQILYCSHNQQLDGFNKYVTELENKQHAQELLANAKGEDLEEGVESTPVDTTHDWREPPSAETASRAERISWYVSILLGYPLEHIRSYQSTGSMESLPQYPFLPFTNLSEFVFELRKEDDDILSAARTIAAQFLAKDPVIAQNQYNYFSQTAVIYTFPTARGLKVDVSNEYHLVTRLSNVDMRTVQANPHLLLLAMNAQKDNYITVHASATQPRHHPLTPEERNSVAVVRGKSGVKLPSEVNPYAELLDFAPSEANAAYGYIQNLYSQQVDIEGYHKYLLHCNSNMTTPSRVPSMNEMRETYQYLYLQRGLLVQECLFCFLIPQMRQRFLRDSVVLAKDALSKVICRQVFDDAVLMQPYHPSLVFNAQQRSTYTPVNILELASDRSAASLTAQNRIVGLGGFDWCVASLIEGSNREAFCVTIVNPLGDVVETIELAYLKADGTRRGALTGSIGEAANIKNEVTIREQKQDDITKLRTILDKWKPAVMLLDCTARQSEQFKQVLTEQILINFTVPPCVFVNPEFGRIAAETRLYLSEFPKRSRNMRQSVANARRVLNPFAAYASLCTREASGAPILLLDWHKYQFLLDNNALFNTFSKRLTLLSTHSGVNLNAVVGSVRGAVGCATSVASRSIRVYLLNALSFLPGMGSLKSKALVRLAHNNDGITRRIELVENISNIQANPEKEDYCINLGTYVYANVAPFLRITPLCQQAAFSAVAYHHMSVAPGSESSYSYIAEPVKQDGSLAPAMRVPEYNGDLVSNTIKTDMLDEDISVIGTANTFTGPILEHRIVSRQLTKTELKPLEQACQFSVMESLCMPLDQYPVQITLVYELLHGTCDLLGKLSEAYNINYLNCPRVVSDLAILSPEEHLAVNNLFLLFAKLGEDLNFGNIAKTPLPEQIPYNYENKKALALSELYTPFKPEYTVQSMQYGSMAINNGQLPPSCGTVNGEIKGEEKMKAMFGVRSDSMKPGTLIYPIVQRVLNSGLSVVLDNGLRGFIHMNNIRDQSLVEFQMGDDRDRTRELQVKKVNEMINVGDAIPCRILRVVVEKLSVELSARESDLAKPEYQEYKETIMGSHDFMHIGAHYDDAKVHKAPASILPANSRARNFRHPNFRNFSKSRIEEQLFYGYGSGRKDQLFLYPGSDSSHLCVAWRIPVPISSSEASVFNCTEPGNGIKMKEIYDTLLSDDSFDTGRADLATTHPEIAVRYIHVNIQEDKKNASDATLIGKSLRVPHSNVEYEDIDQVLAQAVEPLIAYVRAVAKDRHFYGGDRNYSVEKLRKVKETQPKYVPYGYCMSGKDACLVEFVCLDAQSVPYTEYIRVTPVGYIYQLNPQDVQKDGLSKIQELGAPIMSVDQLSAVMKRVIMERAKTPTTAPVSNYTGTNTYGAANNTYGNTNTYGAANNTYGNNTNTYGNNTYASGNNTYASGNNNYGNQANNNNTNNYGNNNYNNNNYGNNSYGNNNYGNNNYGNNNYGNQNNNYQGSNNYGNQNNNYQGNNNYSNQNNNNYGNNSYNANQGTQQNYNNNAYNNQQQPNYNNNQQQQNYNNNNNNNQPPPPPQRSRPFNSYNN